MAPRRPVTGRLGAAALALLATVAPAPAPATSLLPATSTTAAGGLAGPGRVDR